MKIYDEDQHRVIENRMKIDSFLVMMSSSLMYCIGLGGGCVRQAMFAALSRPSPPALLKMHKTCIFSYKYAVF